MYKASNKIVPQSKSTREDITHERIHLSIFMTAVLHVEAQLNVQYISVEQSDQYLTDIKLIFNSYKQLSD